MNDIDAEQERFQIELEFIQCLSNPKYLHFLAQRGFLQDPQFIEYLAYLQYWTQMPYLQYIQYPHCLFFLKELQGEGFRNALGRAEYGEYLHQQQYYHWLNRFPTQ